MKALEDRDTSTSAQPLRYEKTERWVRVRFEDEFMADSKNVLLVFEPRRLPVYYFPVADVRTDLLENSERAHPSEIGTKQFHHAVVGFRRAEDAAWTLEDLPTELAALEGHVAFYWNKMDAWFEEDDEVFVHPRDPYKRVDVLQSSRHVKVEIDGVTVAETTRPRLLFETGLPTRYYIPKVDVRMDLLEPTTTRTRCPYKGEAVYWSARIGDKVHEDIVWSYPAPIPECPKIENHLAFFQEKVDAIYVDGEKQPVPLTPWSRKRS